MPGPTVRTDIIDVYVFRQPAARGGVDFLQLRRAKGAMVGTWQPVMGHADEGESAVDTALRELREETGYTADRGIVGMWQLESVNTYFLASHNSIMLSPGFAVQVEASVEPALNDEHDAHRWVARDHADRAFLWPGQRTAVEQIVRDLVPQDSPMRDVLRVCV